MLYLIRRPRPEGHVAPFHPVVMVPSRPIAQWEAGSTGDLADVWSKYDPCHEAAGFLRVRWRGLDIDYGHVVHGIPLPDATEAGIDHERDAEPWSLIDGAIWWSTLLRPPDWLSSRVVEQPDEFTVNSIQMAEGYCDPEDQFRMRPRRTW